MVANLVSDHTSSPSSAEPGVKQRLYCVRAVDLSGNRLNAPTCFLETPRHCLRTDCQQDHARGDVTPAKWVSQGSLQYFLIFLCLCFPPSSQPGREQTRPEPRPSNLDLRMVRPSGPYSSHAIAYRHCFLLRPAGRFQSVLHLVSVAAAHATHRQPTGHDMTSVLSVSEQCRVGRVCASPSLPY